MSLPLLALISVRPPPSGYCAHHRRSPHQGRAQCGASSPTLTVSVLVPLILLSRFYEPSYLSESAAHVKVPTAAIAYLSGKCSLPSAAARGTRSARLIPIRFSRFPCLPWLAPGSSVTPMSPGLVHPSSLCTISAAYGQAQGSQGLICS